MLLGCGAGMTWTAYIIAVRIPFLKKVIRSKLCGPASTEDCAWKGFRMRFIMPTKVTSVEFSVFFMTVLNSTASRHLLLIVTHCMSIINL
jgi:hypothetical protein